MPLLSLKKNQFEEIEGFIVDCYRRTHSTINLNSCLPLSYTISIGIITVIPEANTQLETLYTNCDQALYKAKKNGRNAIFHHRLGIQEEMTIS